jgi:hypothetical protein
VVRLGARPPDLDIDIKDVQKVFGRIGSTSQAPLPAQPPLGFPSG